MYTHCLPVALVQLFTIAINTTGSGAVSFTPASRRVQAYARPLGVTMVIFGIIVLMMGTPHSAPTHLSPATSDRHIGVYRYFLVQKALTLGQFPTARLGIAGVALVLAVIVAVVFGVLVSGRS